MAIIQIFSPEYCASPFFSFTIFQFFWPVIQFFFQAVDPHVIVTLNTLDLYNLIFIIIICHI